MSKSLITTDPNWLHNSHAGELLASEFLEPLEMSAETLAAAIDLPAETVRAVIDGRSPMFAELDLRLGRYFRMSEGFFLRLQDQYELLEAKRALNGSLDRIVPRAA
jgi:addiction module HigA family antidote